MFLSSHVPGQIGKAMKEHSAIVTRSRTAQLWAVHPGGGSILDAVESGLALSPDDLRAPRQVLSSFWNMSSATVMFVLEKLMRDAANGQAGCAISFGSGPTAEIMRFHAV